MTIAVRCGYTSLLKTLKHSLFLRIIKTWLRKKQELSFAVCAQIEVGSLRLLSSIIFAKFMVLAYNSLQPILPNKIEWLNARIGLS
jgi:hypothetical protein